MTATHQLGLGQSSSVPAIAQRWITRRDVRRMLDPERSVLLDTETTTLFGSVCEIAIISPNGDVLLDTLVNPGGPISPAAQAVHGLRDADVADAPPWSQILPRLTEVVAGRHLVAYNAPYDQAVITSMSGASHPLSHPSRWRCAMRARSVLERTDGWQRLGGNHRALGDCYAMLAVLEELAHTSVR